MVRPAICEAHIYFDDEKYQRVKREGKNERDTPLGAGLCDACQVFGATGWQRRFRMTLGTGEPLFHGNSVLVPSGRIHRWTDRNGNPRSRARGWYLGSGRVGQGIEADFRSISGLFDFETLVVPMLKLAQDWDALGAKTQDGYGVVNLRRIKDGQENCDRCHNRNSPRMTGSLESGPHVREMAPMNRGCGAAPRNDQMEKGRLQYEQHWNQPPSHPRILSIRVLAQGRQPTLNTTSIPYPNRLLVRQDKNGAPRPRDGCASVY